MTQQTINNSVWVWIAGCLMSIVILAGAGILYDTRRLIYDQQCSISALERTKADRVEIRDIVTRIENKVDQIYDMHLEPRIIEKETGNIRMKTKEQLKKELWGK